MKFSFKFKKPVAKPAPTKKAPKKVSKVEAVKINIKAREIIKNQHATTPLPTKKDWNEFDKIILDKTKPKLNPNGIVVEKVKVEKVGNVKKTIVKVVQEIPPDKELNKLPKPEIVIEVAIPAEVPPCKWTIPDGIILSTAMAYFARHWIAQNADAKRLLALQCESYGLNPPMLTTNEHLESIQNAIVDMITKGKKLKDISEPIRNLIAWPNFNGGFIGR